MSKNDQMENALAKSRLLLARPMASPQSVHLPETREQYGAICYRLHRDKQGIEVLLITTRDSRRWAIPKGWPIAGKSPHQVVKQEALEEAGVSGKVSKKAFGRFTYLKSLADGQRIYCVVQVHLLKVENVFDRFKERGERDLLWCNCFEAAVKVNEPELKGMFRTLCARQKGML